jgi:hypothetical protein
VTTLSERLLYSCVMPRFGGAVWKGLARMLAGSLEGVVILIECKRTGTAIYTRDGGHFSGRHLRTLQRRVSEWRAHHGRKAEAEQSD